MAGVLLLFSFVILGPALGPVYGEKEEFEADALKIEFADSEPAIEMSKADLLALDATSVQDVYISYIDAVKPAHVLYLTDLLAHVEADAGSAVFANSYDGYFSVYQPDFVERYAPYLILAFEGMAPDEMQLGESPDLGPYYITFDERPAKGSAELYDPDNKRPYGVNWIKIGPYEEMMAPFYRGKLAKVSEKIEHGRQLYIDNCMSCHAFGEGKLGGDFSNRTSQLLTIHAEINMRYFKDMVREPAKWIPGVLMSAHPHYTDEDIEAIAAFLRRAK
jgi:cytochrome c2